MSTNTTNLTVRHETPEDLDAINSVHVAAFPTPVESEIVRRLRNDNILFISLVAERAGEIVGHIAFSPVNIYSPAGVVVGEGVGLGPVAVHPDCHGEGVGTRLCKAGLAACTGLAAPYIVVLGDPDYYGRFGFEPARTYNVTNEYGADDAFMISILLDNEIPPEGGLARYSSAFETT